MKPCNESERLQLLLDGELSPADEREVRRHVLECAGCSEELAPATSGNLKEWSLA